MAPLHSQFDHACPLPQESKLAKKTGYKDGAALAKSSSFLLKFVKKEVRG